jgi:hypothetical protein
VFCLPKDGDDITESDLEYNTLDLTQMSEVISLLTSAIASNICDTQSKQFAEHLMGVTLRHLNKVVQGIVAKQQEVTTRGMSTEQFLADTRHVLSIMTGHIIELRSFLPRARGSVSTPVSLSEVQNPWMSEEQQRLLAIWQELDQKVMMPVHFSQFSSIFLFIVRRHRWKAS